MKRTSSEQDPSRALLSWLNATLSCQQSKVQLLGNGLAYCLLMHHHFPMEAPLKRVCLIPRRVPDFISNLRYLQQVLSSLKWYHIGFDINRVASNSYQDNLQLLSKLHAAITKPEASVHRSMGDSQPYMAKNTGRKTQTPKNLPSPYPSSFHTKTGPYPSQHNLQLIHMGLATPLKMTLKTQASLQSTVLDQIKTVIGTKQLTDRQKIKNLKLMLGIEIDDEKYSEEDEKDLLSDDNNKNTAIVIDDS